jgi:prepilin-type N-terminal cleavage/methylation domain-containing protein
MQNKGFTLIELLVVIAIIGILAGIIVVSMGGAQKSAQDAKIQATMDQFRTGAQLYSLKHNSVYGSNSALVSASDCVGSGANALTGTMVVDDTTVNSLCLNITPTISIAANGVSWCASKVLSDGTTYWCVDSNGLSGKSNAAGLTTCAAGTGCTLLP